MKIPGIRSALSAALLLALGAAAAGQARNQAEIALQAAIRAETVDGNLAEAIKRYGGVADTYKSNRPVAASALVHMAECYQKLGDAESRRIWQRLVRDFADQPEAVAVARARLGADAPQGAPPVRGDRSLWSGIDVDLFGTISPDGRYLSYTDWFTTNNTMVHDFVTGRDRAVTGNVARFGEFGYSGWSSISRDGREIVYEWKPAGSKLDELRLSSLAGTGVPESRLLKQFAEGEAPRPFDWSPDGKWIAVLIERVDGASTMGVLSADGTTLRRLKSVDWRGVNKMVFSPDGTSFAYDIAASDDGRRAEIRVMSVDATSDRLIVPEGAGNRVMAWAADGHLVFSSERTGTLGLWIVPVADGRATGAPKLAKDNLSSSWSLGLSRSGTLYIWKRGSAPYVKVAPINWSTGRLLEDDRESFQQFIDSRGRPTWSRDGRFMVFISCSVAGAGPCALYVRDTASGVVRAVPHQLRYLGFPRISPDGQWIVTDGRDTNGRGRLFLINTSTGATTRLAPDGENAARNPEWSLDGRTIRYQELRGSDRVVVERSLQSNDTKEMLRLPQGVSDWVRISPDDKLFAYIHNDSAARSSTLMVGSMRGGEARPLVSGAYNTFAFLWVWMPDSSGILLERTEPAGKPEALWLAPLSGQPRKLDIDITQWQDGGVFSIHPDGRHLAFAAFAGNPGAEVWALENFLPSPPVHGSR